MLTSARYLILASAALATAALATAALASENWDWPTELSHRQWRPDTLNWAQVNHPSSPSTASLQNQTPPPREAWCDPTSVVTDTPNDCAKHDSRLEDWLYDFLDLPPGSDLPGVTAFPAECPSNCSP